MTFFLFLIEKIKKYISKRERKALRFLGFNAFNILIRLNLILWNYIIIIIFCIKALNSSDLITNLVLEDFCLSCKYFTLLFEINTSIKIFKTLDFN